MKEYYEALGLSETATDEEIAAKYKELKEKYSEDRWLDGEAGNDAAKKLTKLEMAYREITAARKEQKTNTEGQNAYEEISELLKADKIAEAQAKLDDFNERGAEWCFLKGVMFAQIGRYFDAIRMMETACRNDPNNQEYRNTLESLRQATANRQNANMGGYQQNPGCSVCDICTCLMCADCCCRGLG